MALPPSLARRDRRCLMSSLGAGWPVRFGRSFALIEDSSDSSRLPITFMVCDRYVHLLEMP